MIEQGPIMRVVTVTVMIWMACLVVVASPSSAADAALSQFFGEYVGHATQAPNEPLAPRDLSIKIRPHGSDSFTLEWTTVILRADGPKRQSYTVDFSPSERRNIYSSAMHRDLFGQSEPLDPLKGDPYLWARINDRTLTVYAMLIADDGGYEMQIYERTLTEGGMLLKFSRNRNGRELKTITGLLSRVGR